MSALDGNELQRRMMIEQVAEAAVLKFALENQDKFGSAPKKEIEIPAPLKWAGAVVGSVFVTGIAGMIFWGVTSINSMQITLARVEERVANLDSNQKDRLDKVEIRVAALEDIQKKPRD